MNSQKLPNNFVRAVPNGDTLERDVCDTCGFVAYQNPKVVVGSVVHHDGRILLCRRSIEPRSGFWTLPAGYLEFGETAAEGATREAWEEARAAINIEGVLAVYTIPRIAQVQVMHIARLTSPSFAAGPESLEVGLFAWEEIPWEELAFPSVRWALNHYREVRDSGEFPAFSNPPGEDGDMR